MNKEMLTPFENDIFALIWIAFKNIYPDKECSCYWEPELRDKNGEEVFGVTTFAENGTVEVRVSGKLKIEDAAEVFAHELAHVAVGGACGHNEEWEEAFSKIQEQYDAL